MSTRAEAFSTCPSSNASNWAHILQDIDQDMHLTFSFYYIFLPHKEAIKEWEWIPPETGRTVLWYMNAETL